MKYAEFGSISHATLWTEDLLRRFASELEYQVQRNAEYWCHDEGRKERDRLLALVKEAEEVDPDSEDASFLLNEEMFDALQTFAPPYAYFGAHEGDGSDFGYWLSQDFECEFDGLKVDDTSKVPPGYSGEVLHVNDHGNCTLYAVLNGQMTEVWAVV